MRNGGAEELSEHHHQSRVRLPAEFWRLWTGQTVSMAGGQIITLAIPYLAVTTLNASPLQMGFLTASGSLANLVLGLHAGWLADRLNRRRLLIASNALRAVAVLVLPLGMLLDLLGFWQLVVVSFTLGALELVFFTTLSAYLPDLVHHESLEPANSWMQATENTGEVAGPGVAGLLITTIGVPLAVAINGVSYVVAAVLSATLPNRVRAGEGEKESLGLTAGLRLLLRHPILTPIAMATMHFNIFAGISAALTMLFLVNTLHLNATLIGLIGMSGGAGGLIGAAITTRMSRRFGAIRLLSTLYFLPGAASLLVPAAGLLSSRLGALAVVCVAEFLWSAMTIMMLVLGASIRQRVVPGHMLGRVSSSMRFLTWGIDPIGTLVGGVLGGLVGLSMGLLVGGIGCVLAGLWAVGGGLLRHIDPSGAS